LRQCPKCLHIDDIYWRHPAVFPDIDYTRLEDFQKMNPGLAAILKPSERKKPNYLINEDPLYVYWLSTTKKWVYRIWKPIFNAFADNGTSTPISQMRKNRFYDSKGRVDKEAYRRLYAAMNQNRLPRNKLDQYIPISGGKPEG